MAPIFLREFNFANGDFFVCFAGLIFAIGETVYSSLELICAIFWKPPSIRNFNILVFLSINNRMQVNNMQMYNTLNQLINGVPSNDPFL